MLQATLQAATAITGLKSAELMTPPATSPTTPLTTLGTDYILNALVEEGLGHLFMVPGGLVDPFMPAIVWQDKLTPVIAAHEGGADRGRHREDRRLARAGDDQ